MAKWTPSPNFLPGDTEMGSGLADSHQFTGSVTITGSLAVNGVNITGGGGGGSGDVTGPGAATDNAIARYDLTTGKIIQNSGVTIDDSNNITGIVDLASTGNTTLGNTSTDYHQVSGTLDVSGSTILGRNKFGDTHQVTGALDIRVDGSSFLTPGAMRLISDDVYSFFRILNSTDQSDNGGLTIGLNGANAFIQTESGQNGTLQIGTNNGTQLTMTDAGIATYSNNFTIQGNTTLGDNSTDYHQVSGTLDVSGTIKATNGIDPIGSAADSIQIGNNNGAVAVGSLNISFGGTVLGQGSQAIGPGSPQAIAAGASAIGSGSNAIATNSMALGTLASASATNAIAVGTSATGSGTSAVAMGNTAIAGGASSTAIGNAATASAAGAIAIGSGATTAGDYSIVLGDTITNVTHNHTTVIGSRASVVVERMQLPLVLAQMLAQLMQSQSDNQQHLQQPTLLQSDKPQLQVQLAA